MAQLLLAVNLVSKLDAKALKIDENEFNQKCTEAMNNPHNNDNDEN